jgi:aminoglycoside phosphotransferase (APT) family kinase protein
MGIVLDLTSPEGRAVRLVHALGLCPPEVTPLVRALTGGVASDILRVDLPDGPVVVKFALERLRVAADWQVPVSRNAAEYAWLSFAGDVLPGAAPRLLGRDAALGGFAMEWVEGRVWKAEMLAGRSRGGEAADVARALVRLHAAGAGLPGFENGKLFHQIRITPYLIDTAKKHPGLSDRLQSLATDLQGQDRVLIHGDVSPKNILIRDDGSPVFLDAECATMGDPAFDVAFCLNHLVLKGLHLGDPALWQAARDFWAAYGPTPWEDRTGIEAVVARLLPVLMLARVDGTSPVEYLTPDQQNRVRHLARPLIATPRTRLAEVLSAVEGT